ncbi:hypothetical protein SOVF_108740, partial [Spinacia oleracea]
MSASDQLTQLLTAFASLSANVENISNRLGAVEQGAPTDDLTKKIESLVNQENYFDTSMEDNLKGKANLPEKFSANDIPKFKSTDNPKYHLKNFRATMAIKGVELELYPVVFPMSLKPVCQKWYYSLKEYQTNTLEAVPRAFMEQYQPNIQLQTT